MSDRILNLHILIIKIKFRYIKLVYYCFLIEEYD